MPKLAFALLGLALIIATSSPASAQKEKFQHAIDRSQDAARIIPLLTVMPEEGIPRELLERAEAIGVFPKVTRDTAYFTHFNQGYGVISARQDGAWTMPAFYQFFGSGYGNPFSPKENYAVVILFLTKNVVDSFEKGRVQLSGEKKSAPGPVGTMTEEQKKDFANAQIVAYVYYNGKLTGVEYGKRFGLNPDNNINAPMYGMKGRDVLAGKKIEAASIPAGIATYRDALEKYQSRPKQ